MIVFHFRVSADSLESSSEPPHATLIRATLSIPNVMTRFWPRFVSTIWWQRSTYPVRRWTAGNEQPRSSAPRARNLPLLMRSSRNSTRELSVRFSRMPALPEGGAVMPNLRGT
jgi:hypothetical protein